MKHSFALQVVLIGIIVGLVISVFDNVFIPFILPILFSLLIYFYLKNNPLIRNVLLIALWIRVFFSLMYYFYLSCQPSILLKEFTGLHFGLDGELYAGHGWWVAVLNTGKDILKNNLMLTNGFFSETYVFEDYVLMNRYIPMNSYEVGFFAYLIAVVYSIFGYCPLLLNFINCVFGVLIGYLAYLIALETFDKKTAYVTLVITLFFPTLFIWSSFTKLKEPSYIFLIMLFILLSIKFIKQRKFYYLAINIVLIFLTEAIRRRLAYLLAPTLVTSILLAIPVKLKNKLKLALILIILIKIIGLDSLIVKNLEKKIDYLMLLHQGAVTSGGVVYRLLGNYAYQSGYTCANLSHKAYLIYYLKALYHYFLEPFPSHAVTTTLLLFLILQAFWIIILILATLSLILNYKKLNSSHVLLIFYLFLMSSATAMAEGNIGTLVRHRGAIAPILTIFASAAIVNLFFSDDKVS